MAEIPRTGSHIRSQSTSKFAEILFFGDLESSYTGDVAKALNTKVWKEAAQGWARGTLRAIFVSFISALWQEKGVASLLTSQALALD